MLDKEQDDHNEEYGYKYIDIPLLPGTHKPKFHQQDSANGMNDNSSKTHQSKNGVFCSSFGDLFCCKSSLESNCNRESSRCCGLISSGNSSHSVRSSNQDANQSLTFGDYKYLVVVSSGYMMSMMLITIYIPFFPGVAQGRGASNTVVGAMISSFSVVQVVASPLVGYLVPKVGPRRVYLLGIVITLLSSAMFGALEYIPSDYSFLVLCFILRMTQAAGTVMIVTASFTMATTRFSQHIGLVSGVLETTNGVASALGSSIGGLLYDLGGFGLPFYALACLFAISGCSIYFLAHNVEPTAKPISNEANRHLGLFVGSFEMWVVSVLLLFASFNWSAKSSFFPPYLESTLKMTASDIGVLYMVSCVTFALSAPIWGKLAERFNNSYPQMALSFLALSASLLIMEPSGIGAGKSSRALMYIGFSLKGVVMGGAFLPTLGLLLKLAGRLGLPDQLSTHAMVNSWWYSVRCSSDIAGPLWSGPLTDSRGFATVMLALVITNIAMAVLATAQSLLTSRRTMDVSYSALQGDDDPVSPQP